MANGASRIFKIMQKSGTDTISEMVYLTVKQLNPFTVTLEDRIDITEEFLVFDNHIIKDRIEVGDILTATTYNGGQSYLITQGFNKELKPKIIDNLENDSDIDSLSAKQGKILYEYIKELQNTVKEQASTISSLESRLSNVESKV